ncbi:MAG TPA: hypothetical protein VJ768_05370, partial [Anaerolineales bacterium]|nr:hypothetical protein [Anaerolineales bacterium]
MTFENSSYLVIAALLLPVLALFLIWTARSRRRSLDRLGEGAMLRRLTASVNWRGRRWGIALFMVALGLVLFSLAR